VSDATGAHAGASAVVFDMDGVLVDSGAHHRAAWCALLEELGRVPQHEFWRLTIGRPVEEAVCQLLGVTLGGDEARRLARRKHEHYRRLASRGTAAVPGAPAFVAGLRRRGVPCAVATSAFRADAVRLLGDIGVGPYLHALVAAEDVARGKPDPEVYLRAAAALGVPAEQCLVFEDALVGVTAARAAGMRVIGVSTAHAEGELMAAGAVRAVASFEALAWPV
jgi:HAD superfamily hydrolase (TIGR01509 family)